MIILIVSPKNRTVYNFRGELVSELIKKGNKVIVTGPDRTDEAKIRSLGAEFIDVPLDKNSINPIKDIKYALSLKKLIKDLKPDLVFSYTVKPIVYSTFMARLYRVKKIVPMITGVGFVFNSNSLKAKILRHPVTLLYRMSIRKLKNVIFQNPDDMSLFIKKKIVKKENCVLVNGSGVNMERFKKSPLPNEFTFFMLSRLLYSKGVMEFLKAAEVVKKEFPQADFWLLGDECKNSDALPKGIVDEYVKKGIIKHFFECENVVPYYQSSRVFVLPSYGEGTPRSVLEAMSCGRAIITTDAPGCRETVKDGFNGFLVPVRDYSAVASKMIEFIKNPSLAEQMGQNSFEYCKEKFEVTKINKKMLEILLD